MEVPINIFKGLYTNADSTDIEPAYFTEAENVRVYPGFIKGEGYSLSQESYPPITGHATVYYDIVFLDEDKHKNELQGLRLTNIYKQDLRKYEFLITYKATSYYFWLKEYGETEWIAIQGPLASITGVAGQVPIVDNTEPVLKVFLEEKAIWIGKLNRKYWSWDGDPETIESGFYAYPLIESYLDTPIDAPFTFTLEDATTTITTKVNVQGKIVDQNFKYVHQGIGKTLDTIAIKLTDELGRTIPFSNYSGYLIIGKVSVLGTNAGDYYAFWKGHTDISPHPSGINIDQWGVQQTALWIVWENNERTIWPSNSFGFPEGWILFESLDEIKNWIGEGTNNFPLEVDFTKINLEDSFEAARDIEVLTTIRVNDNEYPVRIDELGDSAIPFIIKVEPAEALDEFYKNKVSINLYVRQTSTIEDVEARDFEMCHTIPMVTGKQLVMPLYINKLTPNGIFLTQTIGKFFDKNTYDIIDNPADYIVVGGISYILKNGNLYYPAVGGGQVLNNTFYPENFVPGIRGNWLTSYANTLGVFKKDEELLTLIDFQPVEGTMLFYVKDELGYRIKDYRDIVESTDGTFLFLREGIYIINQSERQWLSEPINDIVEAAYDNGSGRLFYNSYEKELYFLTSFGYYVFRFQTRTWSKFTLNLPKYLAILPKTGGITMPLSDPDPVVDVVDDYGGNTYFLTAQYKYKLTPRVPKQGKLKTMYFGGTDLNVKKVLESARYDIEGKLNDKVVGTRKAVRIFTPLRQRIAKDGVDVSFNFEGKLYGMQLTIGGRLLERV